MPVNVKLLKKVRKLIAEEPRRLKMDTYGKKVSGKKAPPCGTVFCLAGATIFASMKKKEWERLFTGNGNKEIPQFCASINASTDGYAAHLLGIPAYECPFFEWKWKAPEVLAWIDRQIDAASK